MLAHPELELVALGSDSFAGEPASRARSAARPQRPRHPPLIRTERGGARLRRRADLLLPRPQRGGFARASRGLGRRRPLRCTPARRPRRLRLLVRLRPPWRQRGLVLRAAGAGAPDRQAYCKPRLFCDRRPARARPARRRDRLRQRRRRREVGRLRCRPLAEGEFTRRSGARQRVPVPRRHASASARDRAAARFPRLLRSPPGAPAPRARGHLLRGRDRGSSFAAGGRLRPLARRLRAARGRRSRPRPPPGHRRRRDRPVHRPRDRPLDRDLRARQPRQGAAGQAVQNANLALGLDETAGLRLSGVLV